jgi:hypothetical protein
MTHNLNHREQPVQKAGQKAGAALPPSPNPSCVRRERTTLASRESTTSVHPTFEGSCRMHSATDGLLPLRQLARSASLEERP